MLFIIINEKKKKSRKKNDKKFFDLTFEIKTFAEMNYSFEVIMWRRGKKEKNTRRIEIRRVDYPSLVDML